MILGLFDWRTSIQALLKFFDVQINLRRKFILLLPVAFHYEEFLIILQQSFKRILLLHFARQAHYTVILDFFLNWCYHRYFCLKSSFRNLLRLPQLVRKAFFGPEQHFLANVLSKIPLFKQYVYCIIVGK